MDMEINRQIVEADRRYADDDLITLCIDVLTRWYAEREGQVEVGRVLPVGYLWFSGDSKRNHFRNAYKGGTVWDWSLPSPYER